MKNKVRNRKANDQQNGIHKDKDLYGQSKNETKNETGLELMIFRTLFSILLLSLSVYGLYMLSSTVFTNKNNAVDSADSIVDKKESRESFVELDSDVEEIEEKVLTSENKPNIAPSPKETDDSKKSSEGLGAKYSIEKNDKTEQFIETEPKQKTDSLPPTKNTKENIKTKKKLSSKSSADLKKKEVDEFKVSYLKSMAPKKIFVDGRRLPAVELLPQKPNNSSVR